MIDLYRQISGCYNQKTTLTGYLNRSICSTAMLVMLFVLPLITAADSNREDIESKKSLQKVVYHVSEAKKVPFVLGNINNHIDGVGGPDRVQIVVVVHGDGHNGFLKSRASQERALEVELLQVQDVKFEICGNTLTAYGTTVKDLVGEFKRLKQGGVVRIVELQQQGYAYLRP